VIPILEAISTSVSALPAASSFAPAGSGERAGGFASTFAAAQSFLNRMQTEQEASGGVDAENAGTASNLKAAMPATWNLQIRKLVNSGPGAESPVAAAMNSVVPGLISAASSPIPLPPPPASLGEAISVQPSLSPVVTAEVRAQTADVSYGTVPSGLKASAYNSVAQSTSGEFGLGLAGGSLVPVITPGSTAVSSSDLPMPGVLIPSGIRDRTNGEAASMANGTPAVLSKAAGVGFTAALQDLATGRLGGDAQNQLSPTEPTPVAENTPPALYTTAGQVATATVLPSFGVSGPGNDLRLGVARAELTVLSDNTRPDVSSAIGQPAAGNVLLNAVPGIQGSASFGQSSGFVPEGATLQASQEAAVTAPDPTPPDPTLLAKANPEAGTEAQASLSFAASASTGQANTVAPNAAVQNDIPAQAGTENPLSALMNGQIPPATLLNPAVQPEPGRFALQFAAPRATTATASPNTRGGGVAARSSAASSALPAGSGSDNGSPMASQTPFSVFFSGPGPGTESAASALPKMILPGTGSALQGGHGMGANASSASQASGAASGTSQSSASQNAAPANIKDSSAGSASASVQTAQSSHREADLNAASAQVAASSTAATPGPAAPASAAAALPVNGVAAPVTDSLPKPDPPAAAAPPAPASTLPAPTETAAAVAPVQMAQLINRIGQSEMRIGMNTSAFGSVEVRTVVHANDVGLVIGSEKGDLRTLLANDLPAITNTLQQQNLRLNSVNFMQGFAFSNNSPGGGNSQQHSFAPPRAGSNSGSPESTADESVELPLAGEFYSAGSLSILA
jgi:hypothetical protein